MPRYGFLKEEIIKIYLELKKKLGRNPYISEILPKVTLDKSGTLDNKRAYIHTVLGEAKLPLTPGMSPETRAEHSKKAAESIKQTKRVENFLSAADKKKLFADIRKYRSGTLVGPQQTMNIKEFAKYFPDGTKEAVISKQINRIANDLKLPFKKVTTPEALEARKVKEALKKKGDPTWITRKIKGTPEVPLHHMRAKGISPALSNLTYLDVVTNSEKLQNIERLRNGLIASQKELFEKKPSGWKTELEKLNFKARNYANKIPRDLRGLVIFEQMDEFGKFTEKGIGGNPMKSIAKLAPEGDIAFNTLTKDSPVRKTILDFASAVKKGGGCRFLTGSQAGGAVATCTEIIKRDPVGSANKLATMEATSGALGKVKNAATGFLSMLGKFGTKAAPLAALAVAGAAIEPLVKQFRNDDPSTYLTNEGQMKGMLLATIEGETPKVDEEILKWQTPALAGATAAGAIPGAREAYLDRLTGRGPAGPAGTKLPAVIAEKPVGKARAVLGLRGVAGKVLGASFSPLAVAATLPLGIAAQRKGGTEWGDIATDPMNWMGPAFASTGAQMATKGMRPTGIIAQAIRLGIGPRALMAGSRFLGWPGLAITAGMWGYDKWKRRSIMDEDDDRKGVYRTADE